MRLSLLGLSLVLFISSGCSLFSRDKDPKVSYRDVPVDARPSGSYSLKKRVLVLPFISEGVERSQKVTESARRAVVGQLLRTGKFVVVRNSDLPKQPSLYMTPDKEYNFETLAPLASGMGVSALVEGKIMEVRAKRLGDEVGLIRNIKARVEATIRIRVVNARTGKVLYDDVRKGEVESTTQRVAKYSYSDKYLAQDPRLVNMAVGRAFSSSIPQVVRSVEKVSWEGRIAMINGERIFLNAGRLSGIQVGDLLRVTEQGNEVFDPETGTFIGRAPGRMKGTLEVISYFGQDGAISVIHSGSGFKPNDNVQLY